MTTNAEQIMAAAKAPAVSRTESYMARVEEHLPTVADPRAFLKAEEEKWLARYTAWAQRVDLGIASEQDLSQTAFDYIATIDAIRKRAGQCIT